MKFSAVRRACAVAVLTVAAGVSVTASAGAAPEIVRTQAAEGVTTCTIEHVNSVLWQYSPDGAYGGEYWRGQNVDTYNYGWDKYGQAYYQGDAWGDRNHRGVWIPAYAFGRPCYG
ncbi:hypothetical protein UK23_18280 [Lentzea aerocolonigenes]|uniref:Uncharacterized protein n=2 Tax=Lentzea aerocolonigenes TaxID=68170 RepID=A0A0F0GXK3_LENAE|nr:hypothetical protein UK23_18280 [Lentzea aerocolonigenes]